MNRQFRLQTKLGDVAGVESRSDGPPVVFIHGNSACKEAFEHQLVSDLLAPFRLIAIDLPGHGESDDLNDCPQNANLPDFARHVSEVIERCMLQRSVVVGWSLGGHIAIEMIGQGASLTGLVITGTPPAGPGVTELAEAFSGGPHMDLTGKAQFSEEDARLYFESLYGIEGSKNAAHLAAAVTRTQGDIRFNLIAGFADSQACHSQRRVVADTDCPIAVIQGREEPFMIPKYFETLSWGNRWRDRVNIVDAAGHAPFWEQPDAFNGILREFLDDLQYGP